jgi:uncharacterized protein (DUF1499 family)/heme exporter protein D
MPRIAPLDTARVLTLIAAAAAFAMMVSAGPGTRFGLWPWQLGFGMMKWGFYVGLAAGVSALSLLIVLVVPRLRSRTWMPVTAEVLALAAIAPPLMLLAAAKSVPRIHDISTDMAEPPAFVSLMEARKQAPNGFAYGGPEIAAEQQKGYPDLKPLLVKQPPREAVQRAIDAARALGWEIVASDAAAGRVEATDTTAWFGFKDDIVVRVRPEGGGSRIDVRSVSRVGLSDLGANAKRIRAFLARLS